MEPQAAHHDVPRPPLAWPRGPPASHPTNPHCHWWEADHPDLPRLKPEATYSSLGLLLNTVPPRWTPTAGSGFWFCWPAALAQDFLGSIWPLRLAFSLAPLVYGLDSDPGSLTMLSFIRARKTPNRKPRSAEKPRVPAEDCRLASLGFQACPPRGASAPYQHSQQ